MMLNKLSAVWKLFHKGGEVANVEKWKTGQVSVNAVVAAIAAVVAASSAFGLDLPATEEQIGAIGAGVFAAANIVLTVITSRRAGLPGVGNGDAEQDRGEPGEAFGETI